MKRWNGLLIVVWMAVMLLISCGTENGLAEPVSSVPEPAVSSEPEPEAQAVEVAGVWDCIQEADGQTYIYRFTFRDDGTAEFGAGWYRSEWAGTFSGTYTLEGDTLTADLTMNEDGSTYHSAFTVSAEDGKLSMTLVSGDPLVYLQQVGDTLTYGEPEE